MVARTFEWQKDGQPLRELGAASDLRSASMGLPEGVYTTFRTYGARRVLRLDRHASRLEESSRLQGRPGRVSARDLREAVRVALDATGFSESRIRLTLAPPRLLVTVEPFVPLPAQAYSEGVACVSLPLRRENPHAKDTRFIAAAAAAYAGLPPGVEEGLMLDDTGAVLEGLSSNFFAVCSGRLHTEEERILHGVTRSLVLEVAAEVLPVERRAPHLDAGVSECFLTSVSREVLPVVQVDGRPVGDGRPGPVTREIARRFAALVETEAEAV